MRSPYGALMSRHLDEMINDYEDSPIQMFNIGSVSILDGETTNKPATAKAKLKINSSSAISLLKGFSPVKKMKE